MSSYPEKKEVQEGGVSNDDNLDSFIASYRRQQNDGPATPSRPTQRPLNLTAPKMGDSDPLRLRELYVDRADISITEYKLMISPELDAEMRTLIKEMLSNDPLHVEQRKHIQVFNANSDQAKWITSMRRTSPSLFDGLRIVQDENWHHHTVHDRTKDREEYKHSLVCNKKKVKTPYNIHFNTAFNERLDDGKKVLLDGEHEHYYRYHYGLVVLMRNDLVAEYNMNIT